MKNKILTTVSVIGLMGALPALAETVTTQTQKNSKVCTTGENILNNTKTVIEDINSDASKAYKTIKATLIGKKKTDKNMPVVIDFHKTANGIIGHCVHNEKHESIAKVTDIILNQDGIATMIIVSDGMFGMGKKVAFDYSIVTRDETSGDIIMPLTEKSIDNAPSFSYDKADKGDKVRVIPNNGYSVTKILDGKIVNQKNEFIADIENISFENNEFSQIIVGFDKMFGMGGEKAALSYGDTKITRNDERLNFQLSIDKAEQFETYQKTLTK